MNCYWGDFHTNIIGYHTREEREKVLADAERIFQDARENLDFFPIAYYPFYYYFKNGFLLESARHEPDFDRHWEVLRKLVKRYNEDGRFITFMGYEWHGNRELYGDHNVYFLSDDADMCTDADLPDLYRYLRERETGIAIPHHTAYRVHQRGKDWNLLDEDLSPFTEIFSGHGVSERIDEPKHLNNLDMGPRESGGTAQDALKMGRHIGFIASADNQDNFAGRWGKGIAAVYAESLTREALWEAFKHRRVYAATGDRIGLDFRLNGEMMGSILQAPTEAADVHVTVKGSDWIDRIEIVRNNQVVYTHNHQQAYVPTCPTGERTIRLKQRINVGFGPANFGPESHVFRGSLTLSGGRILDVEKHYTCSGQSCRQMSDKRCEFSLTTRGRTFTQGLTFEIEASPQDCMTFEINGETFTRTVAQALERSESMAYREESERLICETFHLQPEEIDNREMIYHHAYKVKFHRAVASSGYEVELNWRDRVPAGENHYYIRVSQMNGQMAWSSPIWVRGVDA